MICPHCETDGPHTEEACTDLSVTRCVVRMEAVIAAKGVMIRPGTSAFWDRVLKGLEGLFDDG